MLEDVLDLGARLLLVVLVLVPVAILLVLLAALWRLFWWLI